MIVLELRNAVTMGIMLEVNDYDFFFQTKTVNDDMSFVFNT